ncbi:ABC transporter ATP-binding protein [Solirubrobacter soli]|uniref:ABC transporter ATP-binding protein n=1 Tax=Solirubrobacter soli TaxID=363832 RepID=UPI000418F5FE|nr:ABC transporter ATP-binding protein [Solirubrobacter soli]
MSTAIDASELAKRYRVRKGGGGTLPPLLPWLHRRQSAFVKEVWALENVSFKLEAGELLGIVGPNGAGKSTLLKILARVTPPTSGRAVVRGRVVSLLELGSAFQAEATGRENIYLNAALNGIPRADVRRRMDEIVAFAELEDHIDLPVGKYSSGMYLRLAFSVAINMEPDVLLADEVLAVGDIAFQERCLRRVEEEGKRGLTVLFVSHDMDAIRRLCSRALWIQSGRVVQDGDSDEVTEAYESSAWKATGAKSLDSGAHVHEAAELLDATLAGPTGAQIGAVSVDQDFYVNVRFAVRRPGVGLRVVLVFHVRGAIVFRVVQPTVEEIAEPGNVTIRARVPGHLLADVDYTVKASAWVHYQGTESTIVRHQALGFRVYQSERADTARGDYEWPLGGVLQPRLDWETIGEPLAVDAPR